MSSYAILKFDDYILEYNARELDADILAMFQPGDLVVNILEKVGDEISAAEAFFRADIKHIIQRLNIIGYNKTKAHRAKYDFINYKTQELKEWIEIIDDPSLVRGAKSKIKLLRSYNFEAFNKAIRTLIDLNIYPYNRKHYIGKDRYCKFLLEPDYSIFSYAPGCDNIYGIIHTLAEVFPESGKVTYEFSDLINYDFFNESVYGAYNSVEQYQNSGYKLGERIIIITEGTSDIQVLRCAFELLYPHLIGYYYFMDFHASNASGSTSALVNAIKSFIGAGIKNKIVAVFDNDTAAKEALSGIQHINLPKNIAILHLPDIQHAENYPTVGPSGQTNMNVNGLACSIEMYLGDDFIKRNGEYIPIQWKGYSPKVKSYQGEIMHKEEIQKNFFEFVSNAKKKLVQLETKNFNHLKSICESIFRAFESNA